MKNDHIVVKLRTENLKCFKYCVQQNVLSGSRTKPHLDKKPRTEPIPGQNLLRTNPPTPPNKTPLQTKTPGETPSPGQNSPGQNSLGQNPPQTKPVYGTLTLLSVNFD